MTAAWVTIAVIAVLGVAFALTVSILDRRRAKEIESDLAPGDRAKRPPARPGRVRRLFRRR